jgi:hypothetical protein
MGDFYCLTFSCSDKNWAIRPGHLVGSTRGPHRLFAPRRCPRISRLLPRRNAAMPIENAKRVWASGGNSGMAISARVRRADRENCESAGLAVPELCQSFNKQRGTEAVASGGSMASVLLNSDSIPLNFAGADEMLSLSWQPSIPWEYRRASRRGTCYWGVAKSAETVR